MNQFKQENTRGLGGAQHIVEPKRATAMMVAMENLENQTVRLTDVSRRLQDRLQPVMRPVNEPPDPRCLETRSLAEVSPLPQLVQDVSVRAGEVERANELIEKFLALLEI